MYKRQLRPIVIGQKLKLDHPLDKSVNRDANSGNLLRGTVFTPDGKWLLVSGMHGPLQVIDVTNGQLVGHANEIYGLRHLAIYDGYVYGSHNVGGMVYRFPLDALISDAVKARSEGRKSLRVGKVESCKVGKGARTLVISPDGRYLFVACNTESALYVVDTRTMKVVDSLTIDSYPVGLAISPDGSLLAVTSQGREGHGGNALNLVKVIRHYYEAPSMMSDSIADDPDDSLAPQEPSITIDYHRKSRLAYLLQNKLILIGIVILLLAGLSILLYFLFRNRKSQDSEQ